MKRMIVVLFLVIGLSPKCYAISASNLAELEGYTIVASTNTTGEFEGADFDKVLKLDNGMIFQFHTYDYFYEYRPDVVVFAKALKLPSGESVIDYRLVISDEDEVFDVTRVR